MLSFCFEYYCSSSKVVPKKYTKINGHDTRKYLHDTYITGSSIYSYKGLSLAERRILDIKQQNQNVRLNTTQLNIILIKETWDKQMSIQIFCQEEFLQIHAIFNIILSLYFFFSNCSQDFHGGLSSTSIRGDLASEQRLSFPREKLPFIICSI